MLLPCSPANNVAAITSTGTACDDTSGWSAAKSLSSTVLFATIKPSKGQLYRLMWQLDTPPSISSKIICSLQIADLKGKFELAFSAYIL